MAKEWRLNAHNINAIRQWERDVTGRVFTPTARQIAKAKHKSQGKAPSYPLLTALLIRAGIQEKPPTQVEKLVSQATVPLRQTKGRVAEFFRKLTGKLARWLD